jgi:hypothetical protein
MAGSGFIVSGSGSDQVLIPDTHNALDHTSAPLNLLDTTAHGLLSHAGLTGVGKVLQVVFSLVSDVDTTSVIIPLDDTPPTNTEGKEFMSATITPSVVSSKLLIIVKAMVDHDLAGTTVIGALFKDSEVNAQAVGSVENVPDIGPTGITIFYVVNSSGLIAETWKVRCGISDVGTCTFNGSLTNRLFGTTVKSSIIIAEIGP